MRWFTSVRGQREEALRHFKRERSGTFADRLKGCQAEDDHDADIFGRLMDRMKVSDFDGDSSHFEVFICYLFVGTHNVF
jgi:hypothetical protein